jgi:hypothetical protein
MHDRGDVASDGLAAIFRETEGAWSVASGSGPMKAGNGSKDCQMKRVRCGHDVRASNEGS